MVTVSDVVKRTKTLTIIPVDVNFCLINNKWKAVSGKTLVYYKDTAVVFEIGQSLLINQKFSPTSKPKNPFEFDYKVFLERKNIFNVLFVKPSECYKIPQTSNQFSIPKLGNQIKQIVIANLKKLPLTQQAYSISAALLVGYDDEIDSDIIQQFSHSGTLHVLSVSGMHTGVVYAIVLFLFSLIDKHNRFKKTKCLVVLFILWLLVAITGFSPSILRAAIMLSLMIIGKTFYKQGNAFNTLFISAFVLLLFNPYLIVDVGFLLSYFAVFGILYLYPLIYNRIYFNNIVLRWLWASTVISLSATIVTLPITLYFFHQLPIWFVFSNLIIIPLSMVLLFAALFAMVFIKISIVTTMLTYICNATTTVMLWFAKLTDNETFGYIDNIKFTTTDTLFLSAILILFFLILIHKSNKYVLLLLSVNACWIVVWCNTFYNNQQQNELVIFSIKNKTAFSIKTGNNLIVYHNNVSNNEFNRHIKPYALHYNYTHANLLNNTGATMFCKKIVLLRNNMTINFDSLKLTRPTIVADCSNNYKFVVKIKKQCAKFNLPFYYVKEKSAYIAKI